MKIAKICLHKIIIRNDYEKVLEYLENVIYIIYYICFIFSLLRGFGVLG